MIYKSVFKDKYSSQEYGHGVKNLLLYDFANV